MLEVATAFGVLAALVQFLGLIRWPFAVPHLARVMADPTSSAGTKESVDVIFQTLNRYLGVAVGEHLGYLFTGAGRPGGASSSSRTSYIRCSG